MQVCTKFTWWLSLLLSVLIASLIVRLIIFKIREKLKPENLHKNNLISYLGFFELLAYSISLIISKPEFIAIWLGVKSLNRWKADKDNEEVNIFLFGNLLNIMFSFIIGLIFYKIGMCFGIINYPNNIFSQYNIF